MKGNTLAIALASLLVGGVAVGAYHNSRDDNPLSANAAQEEGRLEYAPVVAVTPVTEEAELYATVIGTDPVAWLSSHGILN